MPANIDDFDGQVEFVVMKNLKHLAAGIRGQKAKLVKWNHDDWYTIEVSGQEFVVHRNEFDIEKEAELLIIGNEQWEVIGRGSFLNAVEALSKKECTHIFGPQGGVLHINQRGFVMYDLGGIIPNKDGISFPPEDYLGEWKLLREVK